MNDIIDKLSGNNYVIIGLCILLAVLVILFIVVLFSGKSKKKKTTEVINEVKEESIPTNDIDFDHGEYVKETTAEFELTPIADLKPVEDEFIPEVKEEESPALDMSSTGEIPLPDFNFDELSKSISDELNRLKEEEDASSSVISPDKTIDTFKETSEVKPLDIPKEENNINPSNGPILPENNEVKSSVNEPVLKDEEVPLFARFNQETYEINKKD